MRDKARVCRGCGVGRLLLSETQQITIRIINILTAIMLRGIILRTIVVMALFYIAHDFLINVVRKICSVGRIFQNISLSMLEY